MLRCLLGLFILHQVKAELWKIYIEPDNVIINMNEIKVLPIAVRVNNSDLRHVDFKATSSNTKIATVESKIIKWPDESSYYNGTLNVTGVFLGKSKITLSLIAEKIGAHVEKDILAVAVVREENVIDKVFTASVAILVSILYINFGCAIDWDVCQKTIRRPVGPAIGCICQFLCMPLLSYGIGYSLFPDQPELQIGMFFTGISPSGGASNIWTVLLDGNLNLSVTMTTIGTILAFGMMPLWIFTLGKHIFERGELTVPYSRIAMFAVGLVIPLALGFIIQKKLPKLSRMMIRIMKPFSVVLILFIVVFAIVTNVYLFKLFSWQIVVAGMGLPWFGFLCGLITAIIFKRSKPDIIAIAIETGIQNTGVAIFLLRFTLKPPASDLTTVVPVSAAIMTPLPLLFLYIIKLTSNSIKKRGKESNNLEENLENLATIKETDSRQMTNYVIQ